MAETRGYCWTGQGVKIYKICEKNDVVQLHPCNNEVDDRGLYSRGQQWLKREDIVGQAKAYVYFFKNM